MTSLQMVSLIASLWCLAGVWTGLILVLMFKLFEKLGANDVVKVLDEIRDVGFTKSPYLTTFLMSLLIWPKIWVGGWRALKNYKSH